MCNPFPRALPPLDGTSMVNPSLYCSCLTPASFLLYSRITTSKFILGEIHLPWKALGVLGCQWQHLCEMVLCLLLPGPHKVHIFLCSFLGSGLVSVGPGVPPRPAPEPPSELLPSRHQLVQPPCGVGVGGEQCKQLGPTCRSMPGQW